MAFRLIQTASGQLGQIKPDHLIDRRTYHMELRSTQKTYIASLSWVHAEDQIIVLRRQNAGRESVPRE